MRRPVIGMLGGSLLAKGTSVLNAKCSLEKGMCIGHLLQRAHLAAHRCVWEGVVDGDHVEVVGQDLKVRREGDAQVAIAAHSYAGKC